MCSCSVMSAEDHRPGSSVHRDSPGKNTEVVCHALLQGIFTTQGLNPGLLYCRQILYHLSQGILGSPRILEWVTYRFSNGSSLLSNQTGVSCIAGRFFASWATMEAQSYWCQGKFGYLSSYALQNNGWQHASPSLINQVVTETSETALNLPPRPYWSEAEHFLISASRIGRYF